MGYGSHQSPGDLLGSNVAVNAFPQLIFYNTQTHPVPPYLVATSDPAPIPEEEADAAAGSTQSVLKRVSSLSIMSRVSSHRLASAFSTTDQYPTGSSSRLEGMDPTSSAQTSGFLHDGNNGGPVIYRHSSSGASLDQLSGRAIGAMPSKQGLLVATSNPGMDPADAEPPPSWRLRDRMKTVGVGLVMALNVGTDPPDIVKPHPCAKLQCWMDPSSVTRQKAKELIGERLEAQYARWQQQRAARNIKYRRALDPTVEDVRALCLSLRRAARHERVLFHYNGHGVPRPTANGEIWVFDKNYSVYVPLSVSDLRQWMGKPSIVVLDCSSAGVLIPFLTQPMPETPPETPPATPQFSSKPMDVETAASHWVKDTIVLCPTSEGEWLPMHPDYPADIFTSCLTTPIQIALRWFVRHNRHSMGSLNPDAVDAIPGQASDRKTPLGELNWIFTAVTDSIAWDVLPKPLFQRLFRQDLLVASMYRNFLLADRILRSLNCTPQSYPPLPPGVADHPMWQAWDLACETCLFGLLKDGILGNHVVVATPRPSGAVDDTGTGDGASPTNASRSTTPQPPPPQAAPGNAAVNPNSSTGPISSISSPFFSEQLTAFEVWLEYAERHHDMHELELESPEQLPVVLQVLLSQVHRIRALELLRRFLQLGPWAVNLSLSLGIFPYVMRLLQSPEYKSLLVNIWASILKFDPSCQVDLVKDGVLSHFIQPLANWGNPQTDPAEAAKHRTLAAFCLAATCYKYPQAQTECLRQNLHVRCVALLTTYSKLEEQYQEQFRLYQKQQQQSKTRGQTFMPRPDPIHLQLLPPVSRIWLCICLGNMLQKCQPAQQEAFHTNMHICLLGRLREGDPHVRSAAAFALGCLLDYAPEVLPPNPPAMSLGPGMAPQNLAPPTFQPNQQILMSHHMTASTMTVPAALTASAVLAGRLQPGMGQGQPPMMDNRAAGNPNPAMWPPGAHVPPGQQQLSGQPRPMMQSHGMMPQLQPQGPSGRMQPLPGFQPMSAMHQMQHAIQPMQTMQNQTQLQQPGAHQPGLSPSRQPIPIGQLSGQIPGLSLGGHPMPGIAQPQLFSQQNMLRQHQQGGGVPILGAPMMSPNGPQLMGGQLGQLINPGQQPMLMNPMSVPGTQQGLPPGLRPRPTVYEDRRRCELDLSIVEPLIKTSSSDGSVTVRYEALMALSHFVEKYMKAFMAIAERGPALKVSDDMEAESEADMSKDVVFAVPLPNGLNQILADRFASVWQALRNMQRTDAHPKIQNVANCILRAVNEKVMDAKLEIQGKKANRALSETGLAGIAEEASGSQERTPMSPDTDSRRTRTTHPRSDGPAHRLPDMAPLRRASSEMGAPYVAPNASHPGNSPHTGDTLYKTKSHENKDRGELPKSVFYAWKKQCFDSNFDDGDGEDFEDRDPLNPNGAARAYQQHRNSQVRKRAQKLAEYFEPLKPKVPQPKQELDLLLEDSDEDTDDKDSALKGELSLKETKLLKNNGVKMTTMLKFHSYEDVLMVCDDQDGISVWDYERGTCTVSYKNGNKRGTRMTSSFWINEQTKSIFFVGCNDGTARLWSNIVQDNGHISKEFPNLSSAFLAVPDMQTTEKGSGMICEWQQFAGSLIVGGHSKNLRVWDLHTEKCTTSLEIGTTAVITSLTTAWDEDLGIMNGGYSGMGPDLVVAGHSNGSLQLFDIRGRNDGVQGGNRTRRHWNFDEHRGWIVDTFFTSYGGRFEIISGSVSGDIKAWDLRSSSSLRTLDAQRSPMTALAVHKHVPIAATGSHAQFINISNLDGEALQVIRVHDEMPGHRIGPVSCLEFHKQKLVLAAGATNSLVSIYQPKHASRFV